MKFKNYKKIFFFFKIFLFDNAKGKNKQLEETLKISALIAKTRFKGIRAGSIWQIQLLKYRNKEEGSTRSLESEKKIEKGVKAKW